MRVEFRLLRQVRPYRVRFALSAFTSVLASVLDGTTVVVLIPLLRLLAPVAAVLFALFISGLVLKASGSSVTGAPSRPATSSMSSQRPCT